MALKDLLKKKDKIRDEGATPMSPTGPTLSPDVPEFQFFRTTTSTQETIEPPSFPGDPTRDSPLLSPTSRGKFGRFRSRSNASSQGSATGQHDNKLAERLHFGRSRSSSSINVPENLPEVGGDGVARTEEEEAKWGDEGHGAGHRGGTVGAPADEENIQEAIRLHEKGNLEASTALLPKFYMVSRYAMAGGVCLTRNKLSNTYPWQRRDSAEVEKLALGAGMKKGGAAKGELVLAMYELANCFRNGWGIKKDPAAAKQYYETAANLGDTDAMNEVAWCYTEGFGTKKDKFKAAQFLRLAESKGNKTLGNTW
ncbi:unnamed protein product [Alternaria alternata]